MVGDIGTGYTGTLFSQGMAAFFHESKSAVLDNKLRFELVSKSHAVIASKFASLSFHLSMNGCSGDMTI